METERRLETLGIVLPQAPSPVANYVRAVRSGPWLFVAGQGPLRDGEVVWRGRVGAELTEAQGREAARLAAMNAVSILKAELGDLDRVRRIVKLTGWVRAVEGFARQPMVIDGASDLFVEVFGERGRHARSAVASPDLPFGIPVEVEIVAEVAGDPAA
ncbi:MAG TPA: RidA family protein [Burkholderiaceae bacterium]|nr:RidA family protein [Burkholderiaceae bacterium]